MTRTNTEKRGKTEREAGGTLFVCNGIWPIGRLAAMLRGGLGCALGSRVRVRVRVRIKVKVKVRARVKVRRRVRIRVTARSNTGATSAVEMGWMRS
jgi:hypothetical protein